MIIISYSYLGRYMRYF